MQHFYGSERMFPARNCRLQTLGDMQEDAEAGPFLN